MINYKDLYRYIFTYMAFSMPAAMVLHFNDAEISDIPLLYGCFAAFKLWITFRLLKKVQFSNEMIIAVMFFALSLRLLFSGPWMPFVLGAVLFVSYKRKISSGVL